MNTETNSDTIPIDLIHQILSRLPAKSISRFCCVSKLWNSIICSKYFNELFYTVSSSKPPRLLIWIGEAYLINWWSFFSFSQPQNYYGKSLIEVAADFHIKVSNDNIPGTGRYFFHDGSYACGLIFFSDEVNVICNPSTRQYLILPPDRIGDAKLSHGFLGFDPIGKQFKVLVYKEGLRDELIYHILTLGNENERWREIKCPLTYGIVWHHICINGVLYYIATHKGKDYDVDLVCFDVRFEKFKFLDAKWFDKCHELINYKGKLGVVVLLELDRGGFRFEIRMWVLEDVDKMEWTKYEYSLKAPENIVFDPYCLVSIVGMTASGDIVYGRIGSNKPFFVLCFNLERNTSLYVNIEGICGGRPHYFVDHVENLWFDIMKTKFACMHA